MDPLAGDGPQDPKGMNSLLPVSNAERQLTAVLASRELDSTARPFRNVREARDGLTAFLRDAAALPAISKHKRALGDILCVQPLATATAADLWLAIGEMRRVAAEALTEKRWPTVDELNAEAAALEAARGGGK